MRRQAWLPLFLGATVVTIALELWASFDGNDETDPWTDLLVAYVPEEVTFAAIGALALWLPLHFWRRYRQREGTRTNVR